MELHNHSALSVAHYFSSPELRPEILVGQVVAKVLGRWEPGGCFDWDWDTALPFFSECQETPWGELPADFHHKKAGCDVIALGRAYSDSVQGCRQRTIELQMGFERRRLAVIGHRVWERAGESLVPSKPEPFGILDLTWAHSFGGTALSREGKLSTFAFNPQGMGYQECKSQAIGQPLPRIEDPQDRIERWDQRPMPCNMATIPSDLPLNLYPDPTKIVPELVAGGRSVLSPSFHNVAHPRFRFAALSPGIRFSLVGMNPGEALLGCTPSQRFSAKFRFGERRHALEMEPTTLVFFPESRQCILSYSVHVAFRWVPKERREIWVEPLTLRPSRAS